MKRKKRKKEKREFLIRKCERRKQNRSEPMSRKAVDSKVARKTSDRVSKLRV